MMTSSSYSAVIIDDETDAGILLKNLLGEYQSIKVKKVFTDSIKALNEVIQEQVPLVFADIEMPEITGIEFLKEVKRSSPQTRVVFVTAYENYALEAIRNDAFDFLCKPVSRDEIRRVVLKFIALQAEKPVSRVSPNRVLIKSMEGHHYLSAEEVIYLEADSNYTHLILNPEKKILSSINLGRIHEKFPAEQFIRISRKHVINRNYLSFMNFSKKYCVLTCGAVDYRLDVSVKMKDLKDELGS